MSFLHDPQFGDRMITLMAALVLVLQIAMVGQRWLMTNIRMFALQSFLLAAIAGTIAFFNHANHIYIAALLTLCLENGGASRSTRAPRRQESESSRKSNLSSTSRYRFSSRAV